MYLKEVTFISNYDNNYKTVPIGFSWSTLFLGFLPAILRKDWKWAIIQLCLDHVTFGLSWLIMPFFYNKLYIKDLLKKGFIPYDDEEANHLVYEGIITRLQMELLHDIRNDVLAQKSI